MKTYKVLYLFSGIGGGALGFQQATEEYKGLHGRFETLVGIDCDPEACQDFRNLTGAPAVQIDLFDRRDYIAFHSHEPTADWKEATPDDIRRACRGQAPDVVFTSPPCKGFSGLLPEKSAKSEKYQALNRLVVRGLFLTLEAFRDDLPRFIILENVPRITTRGEKLLHTVEGMLRAYGFVTSWANHDCGKIGGLGQHRKRFLLVARNPEKVPAFIYLPPEQRVKSIGEVIGPLPMPDDPKMGPLHRLPNLQWKTWMRLALIPAGGDWRDLENIKPEQYRLEYVPRGGGPFGVQDWDKPGATVIGNASIKGRNAAAVADPRLGHHPREGVYRVQKFNEPSTTVTGSAKVGTSNGATCIADPRLKERDNRHPGVYQVVKFDEPGPCVTGTRFGSGAPAIADPRTGFKESTHGAIYRVTPWDGPSNTVTGAIRPNNGAISIADPRMSCTPRGNTKGPFGVQKWEESSSTVFGNMDIHAGAAAVADPRIPADNESGKWIIISLDGTWHRPLTTLELAALQGFPVKMKDGRPLTLAGNSDARWRERIGNAVPPPAAKAIAETVLRALLPSEKREWVLGFTGVWVRDQKGEIIKNGGRTYEVRISGDQVC